MHEKMSNAYENMARKSKGKTKGKLGLDFRVMLICFLLAPRELSHVLMLPTFIRKTTSSNPGRGTDYPEFSMVLFSHAR
jgi:hypothetical protein